MTASLIKKRAELERVPYHGEVPHHGHFHQPGCSSRAQLPAPNAASSCWSCNTSQRCRSGGSGLGSRLASFHHPLRHWCCSATVLLDLATLRQPMESQSLWLQLNQSSMKASHCWTRQSSLCSSWSYVANTSTSWAVSQKWRLQLWLTIDNIYGLTDEYSTD